MPPISHFRNIPLTWAHPYNGADACKALCAASAYFITCRQAQLDDLRAHQCASSAGILPLTWAPPYEKRDTGMRLFFLTYIIMYVSNVSLRRHYPHQVVGRSVQPPLSRLTRQLPILISNSLSTSIPLSDRNINIFFCDVTPYAATHY